MSAVEDLAADYVLGVLGEAEAADVERRLEALSSEDDRALARAVADMREWLLALDLTAPEAELSAGAWQEIESRLGSRPPAALSRPAPSPARAPTPRRRGREPRARRAEAPRPVNRWRPAAIAATLVAIVLAASLVWQSIMPPAPEVLVVLLDSDSRPVAMLEATNDDALVVTPLTEVALQASQVMELWTKPDPDGPPISVGLLEDVARRVLRNAELTRPAAGQLYEITIEPAGGSPTGLPTGPVVGIGNAQVPLVNSL